MREIVNRALIPILVLIDLIYSLAIDLTFLRAAILQALWQSATVGFQEHTIP
jgi:hypothetical protein